MKAQKVLCSLLVLMLLGLSAAVPVAEPHHGRGGYPIAVAYPVPVVYRPPPPPPPIFVAQPAYYRRRPPSILVSSVAILGRK